MSYFSTLCCYYIILSLLEGELSKYIYCPMQSISEWNTHGGYGQESRVEKWAKWNLSTGLLMDCQVKGKNHRDEFSSG